MLHEMWLLPPFLHVDTTAEFSDAWQLDDWLSHRARNNGTVFRDMQVYKTAV